MCSIHKDDKYDNFNIEKFPRYDILSNKISQNIEILPSTTDKQTYTQRQTHTHTHAHAHTHTHTHTHTRTHTHTLHAQANR